ncbi:MAG: hypothetical protein HZB16_04360 [Armatimonadetes bacterium]|nr:hypothetical protein [Armatimonadota bacterium]
MIAALLGLALLAAGLAVALARKSALHWLPAAVEHGVRNFFVVRSRPTHVLFAVVDHFEPSRGNASDELAAARLGAWLEHWPEVAAQHRDGDGRPPQHTWFYPWDEWRDGEVAALGALCFAGLGEVELHLHHDGDTAETLRAKLLAARAAFARHGALLGLGDPVQPRYGFVHGDWALTNSHPSGRHCGVNDELTVLADTGCYADFTLPTPDATQPRWANRIARASSAPGRPRSHEQARPLLAGRPSDGLLLVPGPLGINLRDWHHGCYPAIERAEIARPSPVTRARLDFWVRCGVGVRGRGDWVFVKLHTHGCRERDQEDVLGAARHELHRLLGQRYNDGERHCLHYCTARELANLAVAAEDGCAGDPNAWRDYRLPPPVNSVLATNGGVNVAALTAGRGDITAPEPGPVDWQFRLGPIARITGRVRRLSWLGDAVTVDAEGEPVLIRR